MNKENEREIYINSELIASEVAKFLHENNKRIIDSELVYQLVKQKVKQPELIDDVCRATLNLLEDKYGILFDVDKKIEV